jgi:glycosyltransferase involved in cell wall biosynthesis
MAERWLVISHEATNSGAPRILLAVLRGIRAARPDWSCEIFLRQGGALYADFARLGPVQVLSHRWAEGRSLRAGIYRKFFDRPIAQPRRIAVWMKRWQNTRFDLVYNNTATNGYLVAAARKLGCPILTHVHELGYAMRRFNTPGALAQTVENTHHFLAVSPAVAADLAECGAPPEHISITPNFLTTLPDEPLPAMRAALRASLGLPANAYVITGCGHIDWVKGTDLFVETAAALARRTQRKLQFVWVGGETDRRFAGEVRRLVRRRNLEEIIRFIGAVPDANPWFAASDAVVVTSRFESFSLVALEAGGLGRPVLGFAGSRGLTVLLGGEPALLAPGHDADALAAALADLLQDPVRADERGRRLRAKIATGFMAGPRIAAIAAVAGKLVRRERVVA